MLARHRSYVVEHLEDMPEVREWSFAPVPLGDIAGLSRSALFAVLRDPVEHPKALTTTTAVLGTDPTALRDLAGFNPTAGRTVTALNA